MKIEIRYIDLKIYIENIITNSNIDSIYTINSEIVYNDTVLYFDHTELIQVVIICNTKNMLDYKNTTLKQYITTIDMNLVDYFKYIRKKKLKVIKKNND